LDNLIALCPDCHSKADRGDIPQWALQQLKKALNLRLKDRQHKKKMIETLISDYTKPRNSIIGEGYYTAAAFFDYCSSENLNINQMIELIRDFSNTNLPTTLVLARLYLELDYPREALRCLDKTGYEARKSAQYAFLRGNCWLRAKNYKIALEWYRKTEKRSGTSPKNSLLCNKGDTLLYLAYRTKAKNWRHRYLKLALAEFNKARRDDAAILFNKSRAHTAMGSREEAKRCLRKAIALSKQYPLPYVQLAYLLAEEKDYDGSIKNFERALSRRPRHLYFLLDAVEVALRAKRPKKAKSFLSAFVNNHTYVQSRVRRRIKSLERKIQTHLGD